MDLGSRAAAHAALGDPIRLGVVDELSRGDRTFADLARFLEVPGNLLAHHLKVLEDAGLLMRRRSEGDGRRRYLSLCWDRLPSVGGMSSPKPQNVVFICTHNSARSQFAAALWELRTGLAALSAGSHPAQRVHPIAVKVASELGVDLSEAHPGGFELITSTPDLVVTVCDRAREAGFPGGRRDAHWSVPDPVPAGTKTAFRGAFSQIADRIEYLAGQ